jgi:hypothetical protein
MYSNRKPNINGTENLPPRTAHKKIPCYEELRK